MSNTYIAEKDRLNSTMTKRGYIYIYGYLNGILYIGKTTRSISIRFFEHADRNDFYFSDYDIDGIAYFEVEDVNLLDAYEAEIIRYFVRKGVYICNKKIPNISFPEGTPRKIIDKLHNELRTIECFKDIREKAYIKYIPTAFLNKKIFSFIKLVDECCSDEEIYSIEYSESLSMYAMHLSRNKGNRSLFRSIYFMYVDNITQILEIYNKFRDSLSNMCFLMDFEQLIVDEISVADSCDRLERSLISEQLYFNVSIFLYANNRYIALKNKDRAFVSDVACYEFDTSRRKAIYDKEIDGLEICEYNLKG